jgi:integrase
MFRTKEEADHCEASEKTSVRMTGLPLRKKDLEPHKVSDIVKSYKKKIEPDDEGHSENLGYRDDIYRLNGFLKLNICKESLAFVKRKDAKDYIKDRLRMVLPSTVRRECNLWVQVFEHARNDLGYQNLENIFAGLKIKGSKRRRTRRLNAEARELERLLSACQHCRGTNRFYVHLGILLLVYTGMRKDEPFNLKWEDIDIAKREIRIRKSKMDYKRTIPGRTICLPLSVMYMLARTVKTLKDQNEFRLKDHIFPMTKGAFSQAFRKVRDHAQIPNLTIHDLRHEAASRFDETGLSGPQRDHMTGHGPQSQGDAYVHATNKEIRRRLDQHWFTRVLKTVKKTEEEFEEEDRTLEGLTLEKFADGLYRAQKEEGYVEVDPIVRTI